MRRRVREEMPARLVTFAAGEWPADDVLAAFDRWKAARREWAADRGAVLDEVAEAVQTPDEPWVPYEATQ